MKLKSLSNNCLELRLMKLVKTERKITHLVLQCIAEIDRRKLYLQKDYPSLFEFLVQSFGYSPSAAMRRIDGARLLLQIPEVAEKIENGTVNLSQVSLIQRAEREVKRETQCPIPVETKKELLSKIENKKQLQTEQLIAKTLNINFTPAKKVIQHRDESVTLTVTFCREQMKILESAQALLSHAVPEKNWASLMTYLAQKELSRRLGKSKSVSRLTSSIEPSPVGATLPTIKSKQECESKVAETTQNLFATATVVEESPRNSTSDSKPDPKSPPAPGRGPKQKTTVNQSTPRKPVFRIKRESLRQPIPHSIKKQILHPSAVCMFRNPQTEKLCGSRHFLQVDHIQSVIRGGGNEISNLQALCGQHNRYKFEIERRW